MRIWKNLTDKGIGFKPFEIVYYDKYIHIGFIGIMYDVTDYYLLALNVGWEPTWMSMHLFFGHFFIKKAKSKKGD